jgi:hypothetical protein
LPAMISVLPKASAEKLEKFAGRLLTTANIQPTYNSSTRRRNHMTKALIILGAAALINAFVAPIIALPIVVYGWHLIIKDLRS